MQVYIHFVTFLLAIGTGLHIGGTAAAVSSFNWSNIVIFYSVSLFSIGQVVVLISLQLFPRFLTQKNTNYVAVIALIVVSSNLLAFVDTRAAWLIFALARGLSYALLTNFIQNTLSQDQNQPARGRAFGWRYAALCAGSLTTPLILASGLALSTASIILIFSYCIVFALLFFLPNPLPPSSTARSAHSFLNKMARTRLLWVCCFVSGILGESPFYVVADYGVHIGLSVDLAQRLLTAMLLGGFLLQPGFAYLLDRRGAWPFPFIGIPSLAFICSVILIFVDHVDEPTVGAFVIGLIFILGAATASSATFGAVLVSTYYAPDHRARAIPLNLLLYFTGQASGTWILTFALNLAGASGFGYVMASTTLVMTAVAGILARRTRQSVHET